MEAASGLAPERQLPTRVGKGLTGAAPHSVAEGSLPVGEPHIRYLHLLMLLLFEHCNIVKFLVRCLGIIDAEKSLLSL